MKVQRPGLKALFDIDLANLRQLAKILDRGDDSRDFLGIYDECEMILYKEIDYIAEGRSADRLGCTDVPKCMAHSMTGFAHSSNLHIAAWQSLPKWVR